MGRGTSHLLSICACLLPPIRGTYRFPHCDFFVFFSLDGNSALFLSIYKFPLTLLFLLPSDLKKQVFPGSSSLPPLDKRRPYSASYQEDAPPPSLLIGFTTSPTFPPPTPPPPMRPGRHEKTLSSSSFFSLMIPSVMQSFPFYLVGLHGTEQRIFSSFSVALFSLLIFSALLLENH